MENSEEPITATLTYDRYSGQPNGQLLGLTKREYFAGLAMQGILSGNEINRTGRKTASSIAEMSIILADELLKQLEK